MSNYKSKTTVYEKKADGHLFPLGQVVPNIDERVRQLENFPSAVVVTKPTIDGGLNLPEGGGSIKFTVSAESLLPDSSITKFDFWLNDGEVTSQPASLNSATIIIETPEGAQEGDTFDLYVRAYDNFGSSNINSVVLTVVKVGVSTPTISGKTTEVVKGDATFTGSEFVLIGGEGNHDKSDWILYKQSASTVEVWSSKNDTENLTVVPQEINEALENSEAYILKLRYHDSTMDLWSEYGSISFTTSAIAVRTPVLSGETEDVIRGNISFTGSEFEVVGVTESNHDKSDWVLYATDFPNSEIWASRNDSTNKTTSPQEFNDVLDLDKSYILKVRYHDAVNNIWSDYGEIQFHTANIYVETPIVSGDTDSVMRLDAVFTSSSMQIIGSDSSNHDKSDWQLCKASTPSVAIWESLNDSVNKTTSPEGLKEILEVSTTYVIKVRYHDAVQNIWSDWGHLEFTTADLFNYGEWDPVVPTQGIHFRTVASGSNIHVIDETDLSGCSYEVWINGEKTEYVPSSITFGANDDVLIKCVTGGKFPRFSLPQQASEILEPLPQLWDNDNRTSTDTTGIRYNSNLTTIPDYLFANVSRLNTLKQMFRDCTKLNNIPENIFKYNTNITTVFSAFEGCTSITSIPENLFRYNTKITTFDNAFCKTAISNIPENLFKYNTEVTSFAQCFLECRNLKAIPPNLFKYNTKVTSFLAVFQWCSGLTEIPAGLFANNYETTNAEFLWYNCTNLVTIPENLFETFTKVNSFNYCFGECSSLTTVPENLFAINNSVCNNMSNVFKLCENLTLVVRITMPNITKTTDFAHSVPSVTLYVPRDSTTANSFKLMGNIIEE